MLAQFSNILFSLFVSFASIAMTDALCQSASNVSSLGTSSTVSQETPIASSQAANATASQATYGSSSEVKSSVVTSTASSAPTPQATVIVRML